MEWYNVWLGVERIPAHDLGSAVDSAAGGAGAGERKQRARLLPGRKPRRKHANNYVMTLRTWLVGGFDPSVPRRSSAPDFVA